MAPSKDILQHVLISPMGVRILRLLIGRPPKTMSELVNDLQITRTAITSQLDELIHSGFVEQHLEYGDGPGRPKYRFSATLDAISRVFDGYQRVIVPAIWKAVRQNMDEQTFNQILETIARDLAAPYVHQITADTPEERMKQVADIQSQAGRLIEVKQTDAGLECYKYACPFTSMIGPDRYLCQVDLMAFKLCAGENVELVANRLDGEHCCVFCLKSAQSK